MRPNANVTPSTVQTKRLRRSAHSSVPNRIAHEDQRAAHGRRAGLGQMRLRPVVAHHLADLVARQPRDHLRADDQRERERGDRREDRAERQVREDVEARVPGRELLCEPVEHG